MSETQVKNEAPDQKPSPTSGGLGAGVAGSPAAGGAPTRKERVICREYAYRYTIKTGARTQFILVDPATWTILKPSRLERSRTGAHGWDIYCLPEKLWSRIIVVELKRSNSGKLRYKVMGLEEYASEIKEMLMLCSDFSEMKETVEKYVSVKRLLNKDECEGE